MKYVLVFLVCIVSTALVAQHTNILISTADGPDEPSICINPYHTEQLVAGANLNEVYYSHDGGLTWHIDDLVCPEYSVWGDPSICCDTAGHFYFFHLSNPSNGIWIDRIVCQKSEDAGMSWSSGTFTGLNLPKQQDKQWPAVNRANNHIHLTWTEFDQYGSASPDKKSRIRYSRSQDAGASWSEAITISQFEGDCVDSDFTPEGAVPCIGPQGQVYVAWSYNNLIYFDRSTDGGQTWLDNDIVASDQPGGWDFEIPGLMRCNGLPVTACDTSGGAHHGTIYINWVDERNGPDNHDVFVCKSTDGGNTWSTPVKVNDDNSGREQFFTWMTIDQTTGEVWFVFYDRRNYTGNSELTDVYMARSTDGCQTFQNFKVSESPFDPNPGVFFGDYTNITAHNQVVRPIWTRLHNSQKSIWTALVDVNWLGISQSSEDIDVPLVQNFPNPASQQTFISFKVHKRALVNLNIYDATGRLRAQPIQQKPYDYGKYTELIDLAQMKLPPGVYAYELQVGNEKYLRKMIVTL